MTCVGHPTWHMPDIAWHYYCHNKIYTLHFQFRLCLCVIFSEFTPCSRHGLARFPDFQSRLRAKQIRIKLSPPTAHTACCFLEKTHRPITGRVDWSCHSAERLPGETLPLETNAALWCRQARVLYNCTELISAKMFTRLPANAHLLEMCISVPERPRPTLVPVIIFTMAACITGISPQ